MSFQSNLNQRFHKTCHVTDDNAFQKTRDGLAVTPAEIQELTMRGVPVNSTNASMFVEGTSGQGSFTLAADELRGADIVDAWNASRDAQSKLVKAHVNDVSNYGV
ncbi:hypothetical protein [Dipodfec virus UOA04_Rod_524]|nr:hypothetical protein [Dipodfec virus UOA04_Rod_524]